MEGKYTPAPWSANWNGYYYQIDSESDGQIGDVCASLFIDDNKDKGKTNARLIAAAPELLEALQAIIEIGKRDLSNKKYDSYFETARAAIAKAKGG